MAEDQPEDSRQRTTDDAFRLFEKDVHFPEVQVTVIDRMTSVHAEFEQKVGNRFATDEERLEYTLKLLDARAEPYLDLVKDMQTRNAYTVVPRQHWPGEERLAETPVAIASLFCGVKRILETQLGRERGKCAVLLSFAERSFVYPYWASGQQN